MKRLNFKDFQPTKKKSDRWFSHWTPVGKHDGSTKPTENHIPDHKFFSQNPFKLKGPRKAALSWTFETGRWFSGCPEQLSIFIEDISGKLFLGFAMLNREPMGRINGKERPHKYVQSTRAYYYDLNNQTHSIALSRSLRYMTAAASAIQKKTAAFHENIKDMEYGATLCSTPIDGLVTRQKESTEEALVTEDLVIHKSLHPDNLDIDYNFILSRSAHFPGKENSDTAEPIINQGRQITIPLAAVEKLLLTFQKALIQIQKTYKGRLLSSPQLILSTMANWIALEDEKALWAAPELESEAPTRLLVGTRQPDSVFDFHPEYLRRLEAYAKGHLRWNPLWRVSELQADEDIAYLTTLSVKFVKYLLFVKTLFLLWKGRHSRNNQWAKSPKQPFYNKVFSSTIFQSSRAPP